jgi:hypothetical protein
MSLDPHDEAFADRWDEVGQKNNATTSYRIARRVHQDRTHLRMTLDTTRGSTEISGDGEFDTISGFIELSCQKHAPRDLFIGVYPWSYSSIVAKMFGAQDIVIGEPEFDRAFVIKSNREEWLKLFLIRELKEKLSALTSSSIFLETRKQSCAVSLISMRISLRR